MGYNTDFEGELIFTCELTAPELAFLNGMLGEDIRDHPEWDCPDANYIGFELLKDFSGIRWDMGEKFYGTVECVNLIIREMRKRNTNFGLSGELVAQGEDIDDRWRLVIGEDGFAKKIKIPRAGRAIRCPSCEAKIYPDECEDYKR